MQPWPQLFMTQLQTAFVTMSGPTPHLNHSVGKNRSDAGTEMSPPVSLSHEWETIKEKCN